jgi:hypothetical protein
MADVELDFDQDAEEALEQQQQLEVGQDNQWVQGQPQQQELQALAAPRSPTQDEIDLHSITHYAFADWCPCCVERSGGILDYRRDRDAQVGEVQFDYTFWSLPGRMDNIDEKATPSLTEVDRTTGLVLACVVERQVFGHMHLLWVQLFCVSWATTPTCCLVMVSRHCKHIYVLCATP